MCWTQVGWCCKHRAPVFAKLPTAAAAAFAAPARRLACTCAILSAGLFGTACPCTCPSGGHLESLSCPLPWQGATLHAAQSGLGGMPVCAQPANAAGRARHGSPDISTQPQASARLPACVLDTPVMHCCTSLPALRADGSLHDACLLAALAALSSLQLRAVSIDESGRVQTGAAAQQQQRQQQQQSERPAGQQERRLALSCQPVSLTCGLYRGRLLADPTAEEEPLLEAQATATVDESGAVLGEQGWAADGAFVQLCGGWCAAEAVHLGQQSTVAASSCYAHAVPAAALPFIFLQALLLGALQRSARQWWCSA